MARSWRNVGYTTEQSNDMINRAFSCEFGFRKIEMEEKKCKKCLKNNKDKCPGRWSSPGGQSRHSASLGHCLGGRGD